MSRDITQTKNTGHSWPICSELTVFMLLAINQNFQNQKQIKHTQIHSSQHIRRKSVAVFKGIPGHF